MKVILYMATTPNGMIAKTNNDTTWTTKTEWKNFSKIIKKYGNMIIGRRTYEIMLKNNEFHKSNFNKITIIVLSKKTSKIHKPNYTFFANSPKNALSILKAQGFKTALVCGEKN